MSLNLRLPATGVRGVVLDHSTHPPTVVHLDYEFHVWLGDELLSTHPCYTTGLRRTWIMEKDASRWVVALSGIE
jgi:hypothetical protein